jgi:hypothetical protein
MKWLINDLKAAFAELKRGATWLVLGLMAAFGLLSFIIANFAFQTDSVLRYLHIASFNCREMTNGSIIFLFCGMIFFSLTLISTFGEIQRYFHHRDRRSHYEARQAMIYGLVWGGVALGISIAALVFFKINCW